MQASFFDDAIRHQGGKRSMKFLDEMKALIPFERIENILIEKGIYKPNIDKVGRASIPVKTLIGALFLQSWYGLSDPMTEELIHDRISFRKFLDMTDEGIIPDETTICKFRNKVIKEGLLGVIFEEVQAMMRERRLILNTGTLIDATLIHTSEPKRRRDEKGSVICNEAYDKESSYTCKRGRKSHGLKMHIATDTNGMIKDVIATTASTHDSTQFEALSKGEKKAVFADSGYMSQKRKRDLRDKGIFGGMIERRVRGQSQLRAKQSKNNKRFAKITIPCRTALCIYQTTYEF